MDQGLKCAFNPGPPGGIEINLVGGQRLGVSADKTMLMTEVKTTWGTFILNRNDFNFGPRWGRFGYGSTSGAI